MQHRVFIKVSEFHGRTTAKERTTRITYLKFFFLNYFAITQFGLTDYVFSHDNGVVCIEYAR